MDVLMCLAGALVAAGGLVAAVLVPFGVAAGLDWLFTEVLPAWCTKVAQVLVIALAVCVCGFLLYLIGCHLAQDLGWCASCAF